MEGDSVARAGRIALSRILRRRELLAVELAFLGFNAADYGTWVAILIYAYGATGPASVGFAAVLLLAPPALLAPLAASLGDRFERRRVLVAAYLVQAATLAVTGGLMLAQAEPWLVYAAAAVAMISLTLTRPLQGALLPGLAHTADELTAANAVSAMAEGGGALGGPLAAGLLLAVAGPGVALLAAAAELAVMGGSVAWAVTRREGALADVPLIGAPAAAASDPAPPDPTAAAQDREPSKPPARPHPMAGLRSVARDPDQFLVAVVIGAREVILGALDVLVILMAIQLLGLGDSGAGYLAAAVGLGAVAGGGAAIFLVGRSGLARYLALGAMAWGLPALVVAAWPVPLAALPLLALGGLGLAFIDVVARTLLQRIATADLLSRIFGVVEGMALGGNALGSLAAGGLAALIGVQETIALAALLLPALAIVGWPRLSRSEARVTLPTRQIALLRRLPLFLPVPAPSLEATARRLVPLSVAAGAVIIREGDPGDRFYILESGRVEVSQQGRTIATLGPGDGFGEIALLHRVPRTATVTALEATRLYALERDAFLLAITGTPQAIEEADRVAAEHLRRDRVRAADAA